MGTRDEAREQTRQRVIDCAEACFRAAGFEATTIRQIAESSEVSVGSVIGVGDKQALLLEVFDRGIERLHSRNPEALPDASVSERLCALVHPFLELFCEDPVLSRQYASVLVAGGHRSRVFEELRQTLIDQIAEVLGRVGDHSPARRAQAFYYVYLGVLFSAAGRDEPPSEASLAAELRSAFQTLLQEEAA